nr:hypothetical protein CFP56_50862 [Quercus suber]
MRWISPTPSSRTCPCRRNSRSSSTPRTSPTPNLSSVLEKLATYRRPQTSDEKDFFFKSQSEWEQKLKIAMTRGDSVGAGAVTYLERYDGAGRIMETSEGRRAPSPCQRCANAHLECKTWVDKRKGVTCAYCKRCGKGCKAGEPTLPSVEEMIERIQALEARMEEIGTIDWQRKQVAMRDYVERCLNERLLSVELRQLRLDEHLESVELRQLRLDEHLKSVQLLYDELGGTVARLDADVQTTWQVVFKEHEHQWRAGHDTE